MFFGDLRELARKDFLKKLEITTYYQPIIDLFEKSIFGLEALSSFKISGTQLKPIKVFEMADSFNAVGELDSMCRVRAVKSLPRNFQGYLFLNVLPSYLTSDNFGKGEMANLVLEHGLEPTRVVLELTEVKNINDVNLLKKAINYYKSFGFLVCIDDVGAGYNSLEFFLSLEGLVDFVKLPRELVNGSSRSWIRHKLLKALSEVSLNIGARVIYKGVEHEEDLRLILDDLEGRYFQGFYFAKPMSPEDIENFKLNIHISRKKEKNLPEGETPEVVSLEEEEKFGKFFDMIEGARFRYLILSLGKEKYLVDLWKLKHRIGEKEKNLSHYKPISEVVLKMKDLFLNIKDLPHFTPDFLEFNKLYWFVTSPEHNLLVMKNDGDIRLIEKNQILDYFFKKISKELLYRNPLTQLPGSEFLQEKVKELSEERESFYVCYLDLDNFKAFNDTYGFYAGDQMIKKVGFILSSFEQRSDGRVFVSHIGGDDFVLLIRSDSAEGTIQELLGLLSELQKNLLEFYNPEDRERGFFIGKDREENLQKFPLASVSMVLIKGSGDMVDISRRAVQLKQKAKAYKGSALAVEGLNQILTINL